MKKLLFLVLLSISINVVFAQLKYTAVQNGNWSNPATWGGNGPGTEINLRNVEIPVGITVTLDVDVQINSALLGFDVDGTLVGNNNSLSVRMGKIQGGGDLFLDSLVFGTSGEINMDDTAAIQCKYFVNNNNILNFDAGSLTIDSSMCLKAGIVRIRNNAVIDISNAFLNISGGKIRNLTSNSITDKLNVRFIGSADSLVNELSFGKAVFNNIEIELDSANQLITLGENITIDGDFTVLKGILDMAGNNIDINSNFVLDSAKIKGDSLSGLYFSGTGIVDTLAFHAGFELLDSLIFDRNTNLILGTDLDVLNALQLDSCQFEFNGNKLKIAGDYIMTAAQFIGDTFADLEFTGYGIIDTLKFDEAKNKLKSLALNFADSTKQIILGSDIQIKNTLFMTSGEFVLDSNSITISGSVQSDKGLFVGNAEAEIVIDGIGAVGIIKFKEGFEQLEHLYMNRADSALYDSIIPQGLIHLTNNLTLDTLTLINGGINFFNEDTTSSTKSLFELIFTVNRGARIENGFIGAADPTPVIEYNKDIHLGYNNFNVVVNIERQIYFKKGYIGSPNFSVGYMGGGNKNALKELITLNLNANLTTTAEALFGGPIALNLLGNHSIDTLYFSSVYDTIMSLAYQADSLMNLGSDIVVFDSLAVINADIALNGSRLTILGDMMLDSAYFIGDTLAGLIVNTIEQIDTIYFKDNYAIISDFYVELDTANSQVVLGSDLEVNNMLFLVEGTLALTDGTLLISGGFESENGLISGNAQASIYFATEASVDTLTFVEGLEVLKSLTIDINGEILILGSSLTIDSTLTLENALLKINNYDLIIDSLASIKGYNLSNYIVAIDSGRIVQFLNDTTVDLVFPVGSLNGFSPITISQIQDSLFGKYAVNVSEIVLAHGDSGAIISDSLPMVGVTWFVESDLDSIYVNLSAEWIPDLEQNGFDNSQCYISHYNDTVWDMVEVLAAEYTDSTYVIFRDSILSFSPFAVFSQEITTVYDKNNLNKIIAYPNPVINQFTISGLNPELNKFLQIYNTAGQVVSSIKIEDTIVNISVDKLNSGLYYIVITDKNNQKTETISFIKK